MQTLRHRHSDRQTDRKRERQTGRQTENIQTYIHAGSRHTEEQTEAVTGMHSHRNTGRQILPQRFTDKKTERQVYRNTCTQTDKQQDT